MPQLRSEPGPPRLPCRRIHEQVSKVDESRRTGTQGRRNLRSGNNSKLKTMKTSFDLAASTSMILAAHQEREESKEASKLAAKNLMKALRGAGEWHGTGAR